ncbi:glycosyltransferase [Dankookia rubra]|uniref:Glycosyltransferase n=1 Tax=Dankookia rubra TaxID=1442381 RepID=A0A4R5QBP4_9PROT|nr:glycosyltransferase [Dankookia rubra]TDH60009.1 glycosyltransferase [Dankookia rubra]
MAWATALTYSDTTRAVPQLEALAREHPGGEIGAALAAALLRLGAVARAAEVLAAVLRRNAIPWGDGRVELAQAIVAAGGGCGWLGCSGDELRLFLRGAGASPTELALWAGNHRLAPVWRPCADGGWAAPIPAGIPIGELLRTNLPLLGNPLDLTAIRRVEGFVEAVADGLRGWAWQPGAPEAPIRLQVSFDARVAGARLANGPQAVPHDAPTARPRSFAIPVADIPHGTRVVRVWGADGRDLAGSPLRLRPEARPVRGGRAKTPERDGRNGAAPVVLLVHTETHPVADAVLASLLKSGSPVIAVAGGIAPSATLREAARDQRLLLLRWRRPRGLAAAWNAAAACAPGRDVLATRGDLQLDASGLGALHATVAADSRIGVAAPLSNGWIRGGYPEADRAVALEPGRADEIAARAQRVASPPIETIARGGCLYIRRRCFDALGGFQDRGDEAANVVVEEFGRRASAAGWRSLIVPLVFVADLGVIGSTSLAQRALAAAGDHGLDSRYPERGKEADALATARHALDMDRLVQAVRGRPVTLIVTHNEGGGIERHVQERCAARARAGGADVLLRSGPDGTTATLELASEAAAPLCYKLPASRAALVQLLTRVGVGRIEFHHLRRHHRAVRDLPQQLQVPYDVVLHDYALLCPRANLVATSGRYCGEPDLAACERCAHEHELRPRIAPDGVAALRAESAATLRGAARIVAPSHDTVRRFGRYVPDLAIEVQAWEAPAGHPPAPTPAARRARVCVPGAINDAKGYEVLLDCVREAAARRLPLEFVVVGHTRDDAALLQAGAFVTGHYTEAERAALIAGQRAHVGFLPSVWPETWSYALSALWEAGLPVLCFDLGAQAERVRATGAGRCIPLGTPSQMINDVLNQLADSAKNLPNCGVNLTGA